MRVLTRRVRRIRLGALFALTLAALAIACGTLLAILSRGDTFYVFPVSATFVGAAILCGVAIADIRYARHLERRHLERTI